MDTARLDFFNTLLVDQHADLLDFLEHVDEAEEVVNVFGPPMALFRVRMSCGSGSSIGLAG